MFRRSKERDPSFAFFDRFGDPDEPSAGAVPPATYPDVAINAATQIRVMQVLRGTFDEEICCHLSTINIADASRASDTQFFALSYTWGGFVNPASITLNGIPGFPVSQNLFCCLRRIRLMNQKRWLWIDQICINQHDKREKSLQIPLMTDIYTRAAEVIIWLGDHAPDSESSQSRSYQLENIIQYASFGRKDMGLCWWRRLWVLQEYSLASREPVVQIGSEQILWNDLCQFTSKYLEGPRSILAVANSLGVLNDMIERFNKVRETPQKECTLLALPWVFPQLICFDPRDKIYGMLGLLAPDMKAMITPDYERATTTSVFSHATYAEVSYTRSLGILALARHNPITEGLPSWAVDFVYPQALRHMDIPTRMEIWLELFQKPARSWTRVRSRTDANAEFDAETASLTIAGLEFDEVVFALPVLDTKIRDEPQTTSWQKMALASTSLTSRFVLKREERSFRRQVLAPLESRTAYQRLSADEDAYVSPLSYEQGSVRRILVESIMTDWLYHDSHTDVECVAEESAEDDALPAALDGYFDHLAGNFEFTNLSTSFCATSKGFVGIGPQTMRRGDRIILPFGSRYPMLLRRSIDGSSWNFLGFVRITGIGKDQLWTLLPNISLREQHYKLR